jgi:hypothetical protein
VNVKCVYVETAITWQVRLPSFPQCHGIKNLIPLLAKYNWRDEEILEKFGVEFGEEQSSTSRCFKQLRIVGL